MIVSGGENVFPQEVEDAALPAPRRRRRRRRRRARRGVRPAAAGLRRASAGAASTQDELQATCATRLARFKVPREIMFVDELPRNAHREDPRRELAARR